MQERVDELLPKRVGHFAYESGHHGELWLELERLALHPERLRPLVDALAERLRAHAPEVVCAPLVEGAFVGLLVAAALGVPFWNRVVREYTAGAYREHTRSEVHGERRVFTFQSRSREERR